jgi:hypothetical protein
MAKALGLTDEKNFGALLDIDIGTSVGVRA